MRLTPSSAIALGTLSVMLMTLAGCGNPKPGVQIDPNKIRTRDDIVSIHQFWNPIPWLKNSSGRIVGFKVPIYFVSGETEKGAFVSGRIMIWMYGVQRAADGKEQRDLLHVWEFDENEATNFRVRKRAITGYFYGFMLTWPEEVNPAGKLVEFEFGYERRDKRVVTSPPRRFRMPRNPGMSSISVRTDEG